MAKEIHFYEYENGAAVHGWDETTRFIEDGCCRIETSQMGLLDTDLLERGYRIFIHESEGTVYEIGYGNICKRTDKALRPAHNLFKMWKANAFRNEVR